LTHLAADWEVAASTQNQAFNALIFLYQQVLGRPPGDLSGILRASRPKKVPVVLSEKEVGSLLAHLDSTVLRIAQLLYGAGLRILESVRLRVKDVDFDRGVLALQETKGATAG
jgi:integrase